MAYRLKAKEEVPEGIRRIVLEEVESALAGLTEGTGSKRDEAIHEARKSIKKIRGVLRLVQPELGKTFRDENATWRDIGHKLSEIRDAQATIEIFNGLLQRFQDNLQTNTLRSVRDGLEERKRKTEEELNVEQTVKAAVSTLRASVKRIKSWPLQADGFNAIAPGLKQVYRRGRKALSLVQSDPSALNFHGLRKRVKDHWYQIRLLESVWTGPMEARETSLKDLETWLGDDHNLVVLREALDKEPEKYGDGNELKLVCALADQYQQELRANSISLAERLYQEKPRDFAKNMSKLWDAWKTQPDGLKDIESEKRKPAQKQTKSAGANRKGKVA